ncbi:facilitated trehalose transporter Tret1-2 homolog [Sitodiplosis mosellana]|uniref:facilitated trehalose transporter Tret1-2 homolog n=1 Tax=Sitodiplosis mosellana TaxID=263140 RepID=UPI002444A483|nr:facilitated trehalose transporter Tret1-2 homolog [Sitodiplosis mosellana]
MIYLLGSFISWRQVAYACALIPILNILVALFVPEAPIWLISKQRSEEAQKSLQVLRGWVSTESISAEFRQLKNIGEISVSCSNCEKSGSKCDHAPPTLSDKLKDMTKKRTLKPFTLITILFLFMQFSGMFAMRPYIVQIINVHGISLDANFTTILLGVLGILANVFIVFTIQSLGKRRIYLYSMVGNFVSSFGLSIYGWYFFSPGWSSIDVGTTGNSTHSLESIRETVGNYNYFALAMFLIMQFCVSVGVSSVPYIMMSEVFPFKSRSFYCALASTINQLFAFIATKTYYDFERWLSLPGVICFYGAIGVVGFILMSFMLPETENRSMEDIELHYSDNKRSIFDINISINATNDLQSKDGKEKF